MKKRLGVLICILILLLGMAPAGAKEKEVRLEELVVSATRTEKDMADVPGSVSVVTKKDMEKRDINSVDEAMNVLPGVFNRRGKGLMDTLSNVSLRGFSGDNRTLILMDGVTLNNAYNGDVQWAGLAVADVERIEVVRGPFSSLYGGNAMGGVVNIISRIPEKREITLKSGYGSSASRGEALDDLRSFYLSYGDRFQGKISLLLSYGYKATNGYPADLNVQTLMPPAAVTGYLPTTTREGARRYLIGDRGDNRWWDENMTIKFGYDFSPATKLGFSLLRARYEYSYDDPETYLRNAAGNPVWSYAVGASNVREASFLSGYGGKDQYVYNIGLETEIATAKAKLSLGLVDQQKSGYVTPGSTAATTRLGGPGKSTDSPSQASSGDLQFTVPLGDRHLVTVGGAFRQGKADTDEYNLTNWKDKQSKTTLAYQSRGKDRTYALFIQDEILILDNLTAYVGFRQDWWETSDGYVNQSGTAGYPRAYGKRDASAYSPKLALVYKPLDKTTLRASVGRAFRPPTVYDLYRTWTSSTGITYAANPDLIPEKTTSWDIGVEQKFWQGGKIGISYFENYMEDLIYRKTVSATLQEFINAGKAQGKGVELEAEQRFGKELRLFANLTYTDTQMKENLAKPATAGKQLTHVPRRMFNIGGDWEKGPLAASLTGRYVDKRHNNDENTDTFDGVYGSYDPYFVADAKVSYKITSFANISLAVDNIFDEKYFAFYKAPRRSWFAELTVKF